MSTLPNINANANHTYETAETTMLCHACNDLVNGKSARWKGCSYKATRDSGDENGHLASTDSTSSDPETDSSDDAGLDESSDDSDTSWPAAYFLVSRRGGFVHHLSGRAFLAAVHEGCQLCLRLYCQILPHQRLAIAEEPEDVDISWPHYDYVVGYGISFEEEHREWTYQWCYSPRILDDGFTTGRVVMELVFRASKGVLRQSSRWPHTIN